MQAISEYTLFMEITMGLVYHDGNDKESRNAFEHLDVYSRNYILNKPHEYSTFWSYLMNLKL